MPGRSGCASTSSTSSASPQGVAGIRMLRFASSSGKLLRRKYRNFLQIHSARGAFFAAADKKIRSRSSGTDSLHVSSAWRLSLSVDPVDPGLRCGTPEDGLAEHVKLFARSVVQPQFEQRSDQLFGQRTGIDLGEQESPSLRHTSKSRVSSLNQNSRCSS